MRVLECCLGLAVFLSVASGAVAQDVVRLQRGDRPARIKLIKLDRIAKLTTTDSTYKDPLILGSTSEGLYLYSYSVQIDSIVVPAYFGSGRDTLLIKSKMKPDSLLIPYATITALKTSPLANARWVEPFAWFAVGAVMGIVALPVALLSNDPAVFNDWAEMEGTLVGLAAVPLTLLPFTRTYQITNEWSFAPGLP